MNVAPALYPPCMLNNYLKTAIRNQLRNKSHSFLNIFGLTVGFSAALLIFLVLHYEQSFDSFHAKKDLIYRVVREGKEQGTKSYRTGVSFPVSRGLKTDYPQLQNVAAICGDYNVQVIIPGTAGAPVKKFKERQGVFFAEPSFFDMFDFPVLEGNAASALSEPNTAMLTKDYATRYFGSPEKAMGKSIKAYGTDIKIAGIIDNPPANTDFPLGLVISYISVGTSAEMSNWVDITDNNYCFVQLRPGNAPAQFNRLLPAFVSRHVPEEHAGYNLILQPLKEIHSDKRLGNFTNHTFSKDLVTALGLIGLFLLIVACVNFINLSTANAINRAREVGVRKALGSNRGQLLLQFFGETGMACLIAMTGGIIVAFICLPFLNNLLQAQLSLNILTTPAVIVFLLVSLLAVTLLSGFYPALVLSGFNPINALKGKVAAEQVRGISLRKSLVVLQFAIAQVIITGTLVVVAQLNYFSKANMGFNKEAILTASFPNDSASRLKVDLLREELLRQTGVREVSLSIFAPAGAGDWSTDLRLASNHSKKADLVVEMKPADTDYFSIYKLQLAAGRVYYPSDTIREFMVNETLLKKLGLGTPEQAIGQSINIMGKTAPIVGVVKDFHVQSFRDPIGPVVLTTMKKDYRTANIKIVADRQQTAVRAIEAVWNKTFPDYVFEYGFIDQTVANYYKQEDQLSRLYKIAAIIAIFISCLGLYGLVSFMAVRRRKEIGIRKVLGAPVGNIILLLSREFTMLITIAFFIAAPLAWYFMQQWLQQYTYRITMGPGFFVATLACSILIAWLTVGHSAIKAAVADPVKSLRTE